MRLVGFASLDEELASGMKLPGQACFSYICIRKLRQEIEVISWKRNSYSPS
jgi:hypothetical protein